MTRYYLVPKTYNRFKSMGYEMVCKICMDSVERGEIPLEVAQLKLFDEIESKTGSHGPKLYHAECYDGSHYDSGDKEKYLNKKEESNGQNK